MDDDDTEEKRESVTLVNKLSRKETKTKLLVSSSKLVSMSSKLESRQRNSTESSDTMECASENEVENIPKDEETSEPLVTDEKGNKIVAGIVVPWTLLKKVRRWSPQAAANTP